MSVAAFFRQGLRLAVPLAIACTIYLYLYPFIGGCAFPVPSRDPVEAFAATRRLHWPYKEGQHEPAPTLAPFRLLALGDPQLEGDTSIPTAYLGVLPHLRSLAKRVTFQAEHPSLRDRLRVILHDIIDVIFEDVPNLFESARKRFDLFGNDFYLAHIYHSLYWWTRPTHVSVLGDLLGSQWIEDHEFDKRGHRFWNRSFRGGERVPDQVAMFPVKDFNISGNLDSQLADKVWSRRILNVAGNHDVGYAGDLTPERMQRFERVFGKANYELRFALSANYTSRNTSLTEGASPTTRLDPQLRIIVLNDMNLDTPAKDAGLQDATYRFINSAIDTAAPVGHEGHFTLILTHIPLHKPAGVCVDWPYFDFHPPEEGGGVREQYLLSYDASKGILEGVYGINANPQAAGKGLGRSGLILNGHDHEGCDTFHFVNQTNGTDASLRSWEAVRWQDALERKLPGMSLLPGRREITVRSMMGDFGGNAGLLSLWFNETSWQWEHEYVDCPLGSQHFWWFTHFVDLGTLAAALVYAAVLVLEARGVDVDGKYFGFVAQVRAAVEEARQRRRRTAEMKDEGQDKNET